MTHTESTPTFPDGTRVVRLHDGATGTITTTEFMRGGAEVVGVRYDKGAGEVLYGRVDLFRPLDEPRYVVTFGRYDDAYELGRYANEDEALIAAARWCLSYSAERHRMPDPFTIERVEDVDDEYERELASCVDDSDASQVSPFDERTLDETDAMIDMTGAFVQSTAAVLAIRAELNEKHREAKAQWHALQHGKRGERYAAAFQRMATWADAVRLVDAVIGERLS